MDTLLQAQQIRRLTPQAYVPLLFTITFWILSGCDSQSTTPVANKTMTSNLEPSRTVRLTEYNFDRKVLNSQRTVLVDFWASWCTPCLEKTPMIEELATEFEDRAVISRVNVDVQPEIAERYRIDDVPVVLLFQNGQLVERLEGPLSKTELASRLTMLLESPSVSDSQPHVERTVKQSTSPRPSN